MLPPEDEWPIVTPLVRVDGYDFFEVDCDDTSTDEEKSWPVVTPLVRVDGFDLITEDTVPDNEVVVSVTTPSAAPSAEVRALFDRLRAVVDEARAATGGRLAIRLDLPAPPA